MERDCIANPNAKKMILAQVRFHLNYKIPSARRECSSAAAENDREAMELYSRRLVEYEGIVQGLKLSLCYLLAEEAGAAGELVPADSAKFIEEAERLIYELNT